MALGTTAYAFVAGLSAALGLLFCVMGGRRGWRISTELTVGVLALLAAGQTLSTLALHSAESAADYEAILNGPFSYLGIGGLAALAWTVGVEEDLWFPRVPLALTGAGMIAVGLNALTPGALIADEITGLRRVSLFGESFVVHEPAPASLGPVLLGLLLALTAYIGAAIVVRHKRRKRMVDPLSLGIVTAWIVNLYDVLVDNGTVGTSYLAPFGLVALVSGLSVQHAAKVTRTERILSDQSSRLENIVASRTAALNAAHDDIVAQLRIQNRSALRLARLSEVFLALSRISSPDDDIEGSVTDAIGRVARLLNAAEARLTWQDVDLGAGSAVISLEWTKPGGAGSDCGDDYATVDRALRQADRTFGQLTIRGSDTEPFSDEDRRLVDLTADYLASVLVRLELESTKVSSAIEDERHRIARELHDSLSQRLYAAAFHADAISQSVTTDPDVAIDGARSIRQLVLATLAEIRTLLYELQPEALDGLSLGVLVTQLCNSVNEIYLRPIEPAIAQSGPRIPTAPKLALYRIVQESLSNALRHAKAASVDVTVDIDLDRAIVEVVDDGIGFNIDGVRAGHGLRNMRARAAQAGIGLRITSLPGSGTAVAATWLRPASLLDLTLSPSLEAAG